MEILMNKSRAILSLWDSLLLMWTRLSAAFTFDTGRLAIISENVFSVLIMRSHCRLQYSCWNDKPPQQVLQNYEYIMARDHTKHWIYRARARLVPAKP